MSNKKEKSSIKIGLKPKLITYIMVLAIIPVVIAATISYTSFQSSVTELREGEFAAIADDKAEFVDTWFQEREGDLDVVRNASDIVSGTHEERGAFLKNIYEILHQFF